MGCIIPIVGAFCPRLVLFFIWLLTNWFALAYETAIWPVLGFIFMPLTTLAYMGAMLNNGHHVDGFWLFLVIIAAVLDLGSSQQTASNATR